MLRADDAKPSAVANAVSIKAPRSAWRRSANPVMKGKTVNRRRDGADNADPGRVKPDRT